MYYTFGVIEFEKSHCMCDSAGIMYWGDTGHARIETAYLNGTGRRFLLRETAARYYALVHDAGNIYFTDWRYVYVCLCGEAHSRMTSQFYLALTFLLITSYVKIAKQIGQSLIG